VGEFMRFAIEDENQGEPHGLISIHGIDPVTKIADIGYWVAPWSRGRRIGSLAVQSLLDIARNETDSAFLTANIASENLASQAVVIRAGFALSGQQLGPATVDLQPVQTVVFRYALRATSDADTSIKNLSPSQTGKPL
jgi:RimJ/RimL family protein N-acetyltransferase